MSEKLTDEQIRELCDKADEWTAEDARYSRPIGVEGVFRGADADYDGWYEPPSRDNLAFISAARELVPQLLERAQRAEERAGQQREEIALTLINETGLECDLCIYWRKEGEEKHPCCNRCLLNGEGIGIEMSFDIIGTGYPKDEPREPVALLFSLWRKAENRVLKAEAELHKCYTDLQELTAERTDQKTMLADAGVRNAVLEKRLKELLDMSLMGGWGVDCPSYERKKACRRRGVEKATADVCEKCWRNYAFEKLEAVQL